MLFNSLSFLVFISLFIIVYFNTHGKVRLWLCLLSSYLFYGWWDHRFLILIVALTLINYYCGLHMLDASDKRKKHSRKFLWISIISSLGILGFFKYYNFFSSNIVTILNDLGLNVDQLTIDIILPVGISFYTFQTMSYTIDIYRHQLQPEKSLLKFSTFVAFFPQLVAGPIVRASVFIPQLRSDRFPTTQDIITGLQWVIWGFFLKVVVADSLALVVDVRFDNPLNHNALSLLIGVVFYAFQIYGDFAGYSLIAIGIAKILGFHFPENFHKPYFAANITEFWRRWHISLSTWLRDYLYFSLGGNRHGRIKMYRNLMITMILGGLWHGASWNFIIWGALHGIYLIVHKLFSRRKEQGWVDNTDSIKSPFFVYSINIIKTVFTFSLVCLAWVFFRASDLNDSLIILNKMTSFNDYQFSAVPQKFHVIKGFLIISFLLFIEAFSSNRVILKLKEQQPYLHLFFLAFVMVLIAFWGTFDNSAFIYFQF